MWLAGGGECVGVCVCGWGKDCVCVDDEGVTVLIASVWKTERDRCSTGSSQPMDGWIEAKRKEKAMVLWSVIRWVLTPS